MKTKNIIVTAFVVAACIGYYAWKQQKSSLANLELAKSQGAKIDFFLYSRPLFALDTTHKQVLLIGAQQTTVVKLSDIAQIHFIEAPIGTQEESTKHGPDSIKIITKDKLHYRIGDLRKNVRHALKQFRSFAPEIESILKRNT